MNIATYDIKCKSRTDRYNIIFLGDEHIGCNGCMEDKLKGHVEYIRKTPNTYWIDMGDKIDAIVPTDKRFDGGTLPDWIKTNDINKLPKIQSDRYISIFKPIANKCLGMVCGNHEETIRLRYFNDVHSYICGTLGVKDLGYSGFIRVRFARGVSTHCALDIFAAHGYGGGRYVGAKINKVNGIANDFDASVYAMGHCHDKINHEKTKVYVNDSGRLDERKIILIATGSFFKTYTEGHSSYAEKALYPSSCTGVTKLVVIPFKNHYLYNNDGTRIQYEKLDMHIGA